MDRARSKNSVLFSGHRTAVWLGAAVVPMLSNFVEGKAFVLPHVLEKSGRINSTADTFDTTIFANYVGGLAGSAATGLTGVSVEMSLYDSMTGQLLTTDGGAVVADHLPFSFDGSSRKQSISIDDLILAKGARAGISDISVVLDVSGDEQNFNFSALLQKSGSTAGRVYSTKIAPRLVAAALLGGSRVFVLPHVLEKSGLVSSTSDTFDTSLFMTNASGMVSTAPTDSDVALNLLNNGGTGPMTSNGAVVAFPHLTQLATNKPGARVVVDDLITAAGGPYVGTIPGMGFARVTSDGNTHLSALLLASGADPRDVSLSELEAQPIKGNGVVGAPSSRAFVIPHVLEKSGTINAVSNTIDTTVLLTYGGGGGGGGCGGILQLVDSTGAPLTGAGGTPIAPVPFSLDAGTRKQSIRIDDLITAAGGFASPSALVHAAVVVNVTGDADNFNVTSVLQESTPVPATVELSAHELTHVVQQGGGPPSPRRTFVVPHVFESSGRASNTPFTFDTSIFATYTPGLGAPPGGGSADLDLYLYDEQGNPMTSGTGQNVAFPYHLAFDATHRMADIELDDLIDGAGGFGAAGVKLGFGILIVGGSNPEDIALQGFVVNSHVSPLDLSVFGFDPQPLGGVAAVPEPSGIALAAVGTVATLLRRRRRR